MTARFNIPNRMLPGLRRYIDKGIPPDSFLKAVLCNNLKEAVACADDENLENLPAYVIYLYNEAPSGCWGSREKFEAWLAMKTEPTRSAA